MTPEELDPTRIKIDALGEAIKIAILKKNKPPAERHIIFRKTRESSELGKKYKNLTRELHRIGIREKAVEMGLLREDLMKIDAEIKLLKNTARKWG